MGHRQARPIYEPARSAKELKRNAGALFEAPAFGLSVRYRRLILADHHHFDARITALDAQVESVLGITRFGSRPIVCNL